MSSCMRCAQESIKAGIPDFFSPKMVRIPDDGVIKLTCDLGHKTAIIIQEDKFEILSTMAIKAIAEGYYRDAVASFAGSLERLYEFFVRVTCLKLGVDVSDFTLAWKDMSSQSERQLGAFISLYLVESKCPPKLLHRDQIKFRNAVIHKGKFPERDETIEFGQCTLECALPILKLLNSTPYLSAKHEIIMQNISRRAAEERKKGALVSTMAMSTFLSPGGTDEPKSVKEAVAEYEAQPDYEDYVKKLREFGLRHVVS